MTVLSMILIFDCLVSGTIPAGLDALTDLHVWNMWNVSISGTMPPEMGKLTDLEAFNMADSKVTGYLPDEYNNLPQFFFMQKPAYEMSGTLPLLDTFGQAEVVYLGGNKMSGTLHPEMFEKMVSLQQFDLYGSQVSGTLPQSLAKQPDLTAFSLLENKLSGTIPNTWGALASSKLTSLDIHGNSISGTIPSAISAFSELTFLWLGNNPLTGQIPDALGLLTGLHDLDLTDTQLVGALPGMCELTNLTGHCLLGPNPAWVDGAMCSKCLETSPCYSAASHTHAPVACTGPAMVNVVSES